MAQHHGALKTHPNPRPGHCDCQTEKEEEDKAPLMSTALSPNTLQPGRLPATAADPRETPSPSISHTCPLRGEMVLGQAQLAQVRTLGCQVLLLLGGHLSLPARRWPATQCPVLVGNVSSETMFIPSRGQQTPSPHHTPLPRGKGNSSTTPISTPC